jgi:GntR family transcriptional regulator
LGEISSFTDQLREAGLEPVTRVLVANVITASAAEGRVQEGFGIPNDAEVIHIKRLREGNGTPFSIQSVYLLPGLCPNILEEDLSHLFRLYKEKYDRVIMSANESLRNRSASAKEARLLNLEEGELVTIRDRVSFDQNGDAFEVLYSVDHPEGFTYSYWILNDKTVVPES